MKYCLVLMLLMTFCLPVFGHDIAADYLRIPKWTPVKGQVSPSPATDSEIDRLIEQTNDHEEVIRVVAIQALGETGHPRAVDAIIAALKDKNVHIRYAADLALCTLVDTKAMEPLLATLNDYKDITDPNAIRALVLMGPSAYGPLSSLLQSADNARKITAVKAFNQLKNDPRSTGFFKYAQELLVSIANDPVLPSTTRSEAISLLGTYGDYSSLEKLTISNDLSGMFHRSLVSAKAMALSREPDGLEKLLAEAKSESVEERIAAINALATIKDSRAADAVLAAFKDDNPGVRASAAYAAAEMKDKRVISALTTALNDDNDRVRASAAGALGKMKAISAVPSLIAVLDKYAQPEKIDTCINTVIFALGKIGDPRAVKPISKVAGYPELKAIACQSLSEIGGSSAAKAMIPVLANEVLSGPREIPNLIVQSLQAIGAPAVTSLIDGLKDKSDAVREGSAMVLWQIKDQRTVAPLIACLNDKSPSIRAAAALALGAQHDKTAIDKLVPLMKDTDAFVRDCVAIALAELGDARCAAQVIEFLNARTGHDLSPLRLYAIRALGKIKEQKAIGPILATFRYWRLEDARELRAVTIDALTAITGQNFGHNYHRWLAWGDAEGKWHPSPTDHIHNPLDK